MARTPTPAAAAADATAKAAEAAPAPTSDAATPPATTDTPPAAADAGPDDADQGDLIEARVLVTFDEHEPNDVASFSSDDLDTLERDGKVDADPRAVAYAKSLLDG